MDQTTRISSRTPRCLLVAAIVCAGIALASTEATGSACCLADGTCVDVPADDCLQQWGGVAQTGADCASVACAGACCFVDASCTAGSSADCAAAGGAWRGGGTDCATILCGAGTVLGQQRIGANAGGFDAPLAAHDDFGSAVATLGDLDGDGVPDLAVGAPGDGGNAGAVWIVRLDDDGSASAQQRIAPGVGGFTGVLAPGDGFGAAVAALGDLDGDGVIDLAVGAPGDDEGGGPGADFGATWILFLHPDGTVRAVQKIGAVQGDFGRRLSPGDAFGSALAAPGDLDGDGVPDLVVGAPGDDGNGAGSNADRGAIWLLFLDPDGTVRADRRLDGGAAAGNPPQDGDRFGSSVAAVGDLDGDCHVDLAVGAPGVDGTSSDEGAVSILFLGAEGIVLGQQRTDGTSAHLAGALAGGDGFGSALAVPGDLDADGRVELAIGAPGAADGGVVWVLFLAPDGRPKTTQVLGANAGGFLGVLDAGDAFGAALAAPGDVDGDGRADLAVGAPGDDHATLPDVGATWILLLNGDAGVTFDPPDVVAAAGPATAQAVRDLDEDGHPDVAVVLPGVDPAIPGRVQVFRSLGLDAGGHWLGLAAAEPVTVGHRPSGVAIGRLDANAGFDLAVANEDDDEIMILADDGTGTMTWAIVDVVPLATGTAPSAVVALDLDGDGYDDLAVASRGHDAVLILMNETGGAAGRTGYVLVETIGVGSEPLALDPEDIDNDKDTDLIVTNFGDASSTILRNDGTHFEAAQTLARGPGPIDAATGDLDLDGDPDLVTVDGGEGTVAIARNLNASGIGGPLLFVPGTPALVGMNPTAVTLADLDDDGDLDIVLVAHDATLGPAVQVMENLLESGALSFAPPIALAVGASPNAVAVTDFDWNGRADLVTTNTGGGPDGGSVSVLLGAVPTVLCPSDIDGDGTGVGFGDLTLMLSEWGGCAGVAGGCASDVDGDGATGFGDLNALLVQWGPCAGLAGGGS